jgi:hypothetical protein
MKPLTEERYLSIVDIEESNKVKFTERELNSLRQSFACSVATKKIKIKLQNKNNEFNCTLNSSNIEVLKFKNTILVEIVSTNEENYYTFYYSFKDVKTVLNYMSDLVSHII